MGFIKVLTKRKNSTGVFTKVSTKARTKHHLRGLGILSTAALLGMTAACGASNKSSSASPRSGEGVVVPLAPGAPSAPVQQCHGEATSATWPGDLPAPGSAMPADSKMAKIQARGFLVAGVDMSTWLFGYDPTHSNVPQGFDIDIAKEIAKAIFGDATPEHIKFQVVSLSDPKTGEQAQLDAGNVDVVVRTTTITCARLADRNFSNPYYTAKQQLLLPANADGSPQSLGLADMKGKKVCATKLSTPLVTIAKVAGEAAVFPAPNALDCLIYLQQGKIDGVFTDDAILRGMEAQDPKVKITTAKVSEDADQPYGIVTAKKSTDLAKFVNGVLAKILKPGSADGGGAKSQWEVLFAKDLGSDPNGTPKIPANYPLG